MRVVRRRLELSGIVQGVGFRPAVHRHATRCGLAGFVGNDGHGVFVEVEGSASGVDAFVRELPQVYPPLAVVEDVTSSTVEPAGATDFRIVESVAGSGSSTSVAPDIAPCAACLTELHDPADRRHGYAFSNCTDCGPRYSILRSLPYDRPMTTMAGFELCADCRAEYDDPTDRRHHAQPTCCPACGPVLTLRDASFTPVATHDVVAAVAARLRSGAIVAVKGLGGYHLAVDATDDRAVRRLRDRKHREEKPLAVLVGDLDAARQLVHVGDVEADLLVSPERPIVLLDARDDTPVAPSVAPGNRALGVMLAPTPLHVLLAEHFGGPLVLTSANRSSEPIVHRDADAGERLAGIADAYCTHDRPIRVRLDDSVTRVVGDAQILVRRARGHAPRPIQVPGGFARHTLACGAELKSTVCVGRDDRAVVSQHLGDLDNLETLEAFAETVDHLCRLFEVRPEVVAHDLHPDFRSTTYAQGLAGVETVAVQHHHAHIAACIADNRYADNRYGVDRHGVDRHGDRDGGSAVIGVAFDGMGLGTDGTVWGGEVLLADLVEFERLGHLAPVPLPGGDVAVRQPWRMAAMHLAGSVDVETIRQLEVHGRNRDRWDAVRSMAEAGVNAPATSSAGRLFDAVAAILGIRDEVSYEGQAAIELEQRAALDERGSYPVGIGDGTPFAIDTGPLVAAVVSDLRDGAPTGVVAARFHNAVVDLVLAACRRARDRTGLAVVALSGGVFQNALLVGRVRQVLERDRFRVLTHRRVPPNDGGISLGQAVIVAARDRAAGH